MQSLKSTAFAVTLLAISFGLYCVSTDNTVAPETELESLIKIETPSLSGQSAAATRPPLRSDMHPPVQVAPVQSAPIQISSSNAPDFQGSSVAQQPKTGVQTLVPDLPKLQTPGLQPEESRRSEQALTLPSFSATQPPASSDLKLPEIATRQPVSSSPTMRDENLIDALKTVEANDFKPAGALTSSQPLQARQSNLTDRSYNSLATATAKDEDVSAVKSADGSLGSPGAIAMPELNKKPSQEPQPFSIAAVWEEVDQLVAADEYRKALGTLSQHYGRKGLTGPQAQKLQGWLDALAGKVIYSTEHHFVKQPWVVQSGETLDSIAAKLNVPAEVIYNINRAQFGTDNEVHPGMELKVVNGPFHAEVDLDSKFMTLFVKNLYAGRFPVSMGVSGNPGEGNFKVMVKSPEGYTWRDANGKQYAAGSPGNGYGPYWIGLTGSLCVHAVPVGTTDGHNGCIGLGEKDAKDVFGILSQKSQISIVR